MRARHSPNNPSRRRPGASRFSEAVDLALAHNHAVRLARLSVDEKDRAKDVAKSAYFPQVRNETTLVHLTDTQLIEIPAGGLGVVGATPVPPQTLILNQGGVSAVTNGTGVVQPLTQLFRVKAANDVARAEAEATRGKARGVEDETALQGPPDLLPDSDRRRPAPRGAREDPGVGRSAARAGPAGAIRQRARSRSDREPRPRAAGQAGAADHRAAAFRSADAAQRRHRLAADHAAAARSERVAIGGPSERCERDACVRAALDSHPEIAEARAQVEKAASAVRLAKYEFVPDVEAFARYSFQNNVPFLADRFGTIGIRASVDLFDGGRKRAVLRERETQLAQAKENLARISDEVELRVQTAYNKMERTRQMVAVSEELLALRGESRRVAAALLVNGGALGSQAKESAAQELEAQAALLQSQLDYVQAADEMDAAIGRRPR